MNGAELQKLRQHAGLTQEALAARSGVSVSTIAKWESGHQTNPEAATVMKVARVIAPLISETVSTVLTLILGLDDGVPA